MKISEIAIELMKRCSKYGDTEIGDSWEIKGEKSRITIKSTNP